MESLSKEIKSDVCIVGAGIVGISTAYNLACEGKSVIVLEKDEIASHTSGGSTGKITSQHGLLYEYLCKSNGEEYAKKYFDANEEAIRNIENIITKENIDCDFEKKNAYVFTQSIMEVDKIKKEVEYAKKIGINAKFETKIDLPINIEGAIKFENQAQFNPSKFVIGLADVARNKNVQIFENSKVIDIEEKMDSYIVSTDNRKSYCKGCCNCNKISNNKFPWILLFKNVSIYVLCNYF